MVANNKNTIKINIDEAIDININIIQSNGIPALQFRKTISACDKNITSIKEILKKALDEDSEIIIPFKLKIFNKPLAKGRLLQAGIKLD